MANYELNINNTSYKIEAEPDMPLLWAIRDFAGLTGTKFGCGVSQCGACTVHVDGNAIRSCSFPVAGATGKKIVTIEGISPNVDHAVQKAWIELQVPQCGYCPVGTNHERRRFADEKSPNLPDAEIDVAMQEIFADAEPISVFEARFIERLRLPPDS